MQFRLFRLPLVAAIATAMASTATTVSANVHVHAEVHRTLQLRGHANVMISMKDTRPDGMVRRLSNKNKQGHKTKRHLKNCPMDSEPPSADEETDPVQVMVEQLVEYTQEQHEPVMQVIYHSQNQSSSSSSSSSSEPGCQKAKSLWISNEIYVREATAELIDQLAALPEVGSIREELVAHVSVTQMSTAIAADGSTSFIGEWGVERIQALEAWKLGFLGQNVRVASIDTGVRSTHSALSGNFLGEYGWYDAISNASAPIDTVGHGTGVMGIIAGGQGFGVAPQATWMTCRACSIADECQEGDLLECAQFLTCPFSNGDESRKDCSKKPHVINNSWNMDRGTTAFRAAVDVWISAGIIPVFSSGNNGPGCGTVNSPADWTAGIAVGATDYDDKLAGFSGRGPGLNGDIKPDLVAPGDTVVSIGAASDDDLSLYSGTSVAAPHVTGAIALMMQALPNLTVDGVKTLLHQSTDTSPLSIASQLTCGTSNATSNFPNNAFGYGRVNVLNAIKTQQTVNVTTEAANAAGTVIHTSTSLDTSGSGSIAFSSSFSGPGEVSVGDAE